MGISLSLLRVHDTIIFLNCWFWAYYVFQAIFDEISFRRAYWLQTVDDNVSLEFLNLSGQVVIQQETIHLSDLCVSALTLEPFSGELWVSNKTNGKIFRCLYLSEPCEEVVNTGVFHCENLYLCILVCASSLYIIMYMFLLRISFMHVPS